MSEDFKVIPIPESNSKWNAYAKKLKTLKAGEALEISGNYPSINLGMRKAGMKIATKKIAHNLFAVWEKREASK
jgi:hypothetical protein